MSPVSSVESPLLDLTGTLIKSVNKVCCKTTGVSFHPVSETVTGICLRWLKTVSSTFQDVDFDGSLLLLFIS